MECSCSISIDHDGLPDYCNEVMRKARKEHYCYECGSDIKCGDRYESISGVWDGTQQIYKTCLNCKSLRDVFFDQWIYTQIWEDFYDSFDPNNIPEKCLADLTSVARNKVCKWIENSWREEEDK